MARLSKEEALKVTKNRKLIAKNDKRLKALMMSVKDDTFWMELIRKTEKRKLKKDLTND